MLRYFYDNKLIRFEEEIPANWEEAIRFSGRVMKNQNLVTDRYIDQVISDVKEYGPYIVIVPGVAMPHSSAKNEGVIGTGIGFTIMPKTVSFEEGNEEKDAKLFFMLAAKDSEAHMQNIANLSDMLMEEDMVDDLMKVRNMEDYVAVMNKHEK
ncbi:PTS ascorbate transporter subunit IIA [Ligilactobacillus agilis]|uniref:Ascorbate-specific PTS system EIIA component n=1 Tax=Ligilactobacillus agilis TaxID=1601 RepID=A0A226RGT4_9LACO|nr:PTS sugar transporter subunit IIA [Ligilactobacillus agilis]MBM6762656.1 PTS sugar transporter subunit IIA [Ligilactobacillus agilis]OXC08155.1 PTS ascorbate transporter subunit IIA [Ligilactobacillus agilis]OXC08578.1 PTS ascorbate transporter subunit IIA [Ligilactobacillus agilis]OXC09014.1 PTS ascorbate transporter subunit IIA [Ligilactobacillus agilis]OXS38129.1 PTS ascorbate transporter subunit IIA [Ligilactobacillus agilis]